MKKLSILIVYLVTITFLSSCACMVKKGSNVLKDKRDGQKYEIVTIGNQIWMAENIAYETEKSSCYDGVPANGKEYGRLYTWEAAKTVCPDGWHLPTEAEWNTLLSQYGENTSDVYSKITVEGDPFKLQMAGTHFKAGAYGSLGQMTSIWAQETHDEDMAKCLVVMKLFGGSAELGYDHKLAENSVRCIKNK